MAKKKVLFYCQHLIGIGHVSRSLAICEELLNEGCSVDLVMGGPQSELNCRIEHENFKTYYLSPLFMGAEGNELYSLEDLSLEEAFTKRNTQLTQILGQYDSFVTEMFPFGRNAFKKEILFVIEELKAINPEIKVYSSVRDILVKKDNAEKRHPQWAKFVNQHYDGVFVHGDHSLVDFGSSFLSEPEITEKISYTGYVSADVQKRQTEEDLIVISAGGSNVIGDISQVIEDVAAKLPTLRFKLFLKNISRDSNLANVEFKEFSKEFKRDLAKARISVSMAGYNTVAETLSLAKPCILIPYEDSSEQKLRATLLSRVPGIEKLNSLSAESFKAAIEKLLMEPESISVPVQLGGEKVTAQAISRGVLQ